MMEGLFFYWLAWLIWIYLTFIMKKNNLRLWLSVWILVLRIFSNSFISFGGLQINVCLFIIYAGSLIYLSRMTNWISSLFRSLCIVFGYVGLLFWEQISPVWVFIPRTLLISLLGLVLLLVLSASLLERCIVWLLGMTAGEMIHGIILRSYGFEQEIGEMAFLDVLFIELGLLIGLELFRQIKWRIDQGINSIEKQIKRWTI